MTTSKPPPSLVRALLLTSSAAVSRHIPGSFVHQQFVITVLPSITLNSYDIHVHIVQTFNVRVRVRVRARARARVRACVGACVRACVRAWCACVRACVRAFYFLKGGLKK